MPRTRSPKPTPSFGQHDEERLSKVERKYLTEPPSELPRSAVVLWPDLTRWPTSESIVPLVRRLRRDHPQRLAILTGLRMWETTDFGSMWAWIGAWISLLAVTLVSASGVQWLQISLAAVIALVGFVGLSRLLTHVAAVELRRRRAHVWLLALEDRL